MARTLFPLDETGTISLSHGAGGLMTQALVEFLTAGVLKKDVNGGVGLREMDDGATIPVPGSDTVVVVTSDGHTVDPLVFPGGDLGSLAACGTLNDLLVMGATPVAITHALFIEEGFPVETLRRLNDSFVATVNAAGIALVAGDTKVMPRGTLHGCISATTGLGLAARDAIILDAGVRAGDEIVVTGTLGDHGTTLLAIREHMSIEGTLRSDIRVLDDVAAAARARGARAMKDPTRGGLATALNEFAGKSRVGIWIDEDAVPFLHETITACEMLGLSPYEMPSEGRAVVAVPAGQGDALVHDLRRLPGCGLAAVIGSASDERPGKVFLATRVGGTRILATPVGEPVPRVC